MKGVKFLAFDFGAESGRGILGLLSNGRLDLEIIHRFNNPQIKIFSNIYWDILYLFNELKKTLIMAAKRERAPLSGIGVDTWGVDFGLLDKNDRLLGFPFSYRDSRTDGIMEKTFKIISKEKIYESTGIQFMQLNTIFQLMSMVDSRDPLLNNAKTLLFMPDLFNFLMTGEKFSEYTIASTSQLLNARNRSWEKNIFDALNIPSIIMAPIVKPGTIVGKLVSEIVEETGITPVDVIAPACHDTASAVAAIPVQSENWIYISSGTWSLIGVETKEPIINSLSLKNNFTNEGGVNDSIRLLRNTMGLWLLQQCRKKWKLDGKNFDYSELVKMAHNAPSFKCIIDPDDSSFLNPSDMPKAIVEFCRRTGQDTPERIGEFVRCILESLALKYRYIIEKLCAILPKTIDTIHIVGGGSQNEMLNQFTSNASGIPVIAGPSEATAAGNILIQAMAKKEIGSLREGREIIASSFPLKRYKPEEHDLWSEKFENVKRFFV